MKQEFHMEHFSQQRWLRALRDTRTQRAYDHVVKVTLRYEPSMSDKNNRPPNVVVYGDGTRFFGGPEAQAKLKGKPVPSRKLERYFSKHPLVDRFILLDEYLTSKIDPYSKSR